MAIIKINRSQARVADVPVPNVSALALDSRLATNYGNAIASVGKVIEDARAKTQKTQDTNDARSLFIRGSKNFIRRS